jgi:hypothetical protein
MHTARAFKIANSSIMIKYPDGQVPRATAMAHAFERATSSAGVTGQRLSFEFYKTFEFAKRTSTNILEHTRRCHDLSRVTQAHYGA